MVKMNITNCMCSYYRSVEVCGSYQPCVNVMKENPLWIASPSVHSAALCSDITWHSALLPWGKLFTASPDLDSHLPLASSGVEELSVQSGQQSCSSSETWFGEESLHDLHSDISFCHALLLALKNNISTVSMLPVLPFLHYSWSF